MPDVRPDLTLDPLELIKFYLSPTVLAKYGERSHGLERIRIHKLQDVCALIEYEVGSVGRHAPTLTLILKLLQQFEIIRVKDTAEFLLPCELIDLAIELGYAFAKIFGRHVPFLNHLSSFFDNAGEHG